MPLRQDSDAADSPLAAKPTSWFALLQALRYEQWLKNLLVFVPLLAGHHFQDIAAWWNTILCFMVFSLCASGQYLINDMADLDWDRRDPRKRNRPLAAGRLRMGIARSAAAVLIASSAGFSWFLPPGVFWVVALYHATALSYTFVLKRAAMLDVVVLAGLYGLRVFAGGAASGVWPSAWLITFTLFLFLSLALLKRVVELPVDRETPTGRGFHTDDRTFLILVGVNTGLLSVVVLALYLHNPLVTLLYRWPEALWLLTLVLTYWVTHTWLRAVRGEMSRGLWVSLATDPRGYAAFGIALLIFVLAI